MMRLKNRDNTEYRLNISCNDRARSKSDMLHRLIAHLNMPLYEINNIFIFETPMRAKIVFRKIEPRPPTQNKVLLFFRQKLQQDDIEFALYLTLSGRDMMMMGYNFSLSYSFDILKHSREETAYLSENIHTMISSAFDAFRNIFISQHVNSPD